jgi:uncharacterized protein (TIGR02996 family)
VKDDLLRALDEDPADLGRWQLLADWLQQHGDPRGELVAVDLALDATRGAAKKTKLQRDREALLEAHAPSLLGATMARAIADGYAQVTWRRGFVDALHVVVPEGLRHGRAILWLIRKICEDEHEPFRFLRQLALARTDLDDLEPLVCFMHLEVLDVSRTPVTDVTPLARLPRLRKLHMPDGSTRDYSQAGR